MYKTSDSSPEPAIKASQAHGLIALNSAGEIASFDTFSQKLFCLSKDEALGRSFLSLLHSEDRSRFSEDAGSVFHRLAETESCSDEKQYRAVLSDKQVISIYANVDVLDLPEPVLLVRYRTHEQTTDHNEHVFDEPNQARLKPVQPLALKQADDFLNTVLEASKDFVCVKDENLRIVSANKAFLSLFPEHMRDSIIGHSTGEYFVDEQSEKLAQIERHAFEVGQSIGVETFSTKTGQEKVVQFKKVKFTDAKGNDFLLTVGRDISQIKKTEAKLRESEERYELAVRGSSVGLWDWDFKSNKLFLSDRYKEILGIQSRDVELSIDTFMQRIHPEDKEKIKLARESHLQGKGLYNVEYRILNGRDEYIWIHARGQAVWDHHGEPTRMAGSIENISERKKAEEEILRSNAELERFAYVASHDLQEPLRMVSSFTQLLKKNYLKVLDEKGIQYLDIACDSANRMQELIRDLLSYARVGNPSENVEAVDLNEMKKLIERSLAEAIQSNNAELVWDTLPTITADPSRIYSVFQNLIGNALKYRKQNELPKIVINVQSQQHKWLFTVSDNGIGMKQAYCEKIFDPFKRLHRKDDYPGTGMGLSICRKTIEGLGGKIWAVSELGRGSIFYFTLPKTAGVEEDGLKNE